MQTECLDSKAQTGHHQDMRAVSYTHLRAHETEADLVCRLLLEKKTTYRVGRFEELMSEFLKDFVQPFY